MFLEKGLNFDLVQTYELLISVRDNPDDLDNSLSVSTMCTNFSMAFSSKLVVT